MTTIEPVTHSVSRHRLRGISRGHFLFALAAGTGLLAVHAGTGSSLALFDNTRDASTTISTARVFAGQRVSAGFTVSDASSGSAADRSSPIAYASDGRTITTSAWPTSFNAGNYVEFRMSAPAPTGLMVSSASVSLRYASSSAGGTACIEVELRYISTGGAIATYGSSGSPAGCVAGTALTTVNVSVPAISTTDLADDLDLRIYGRDSTSVGMVVDSASVSIDTGSLSLTLLPLRYIDAADGSATTTSWGLSGP